MFDAQTALSQAVALQKAGRLAEAESLHHRILEARPDSLSSLHFLAVRASQAGKTDEAAQFLRRYLAIRPNDADALQALAHLSEQAGHIDEAILCLGRAFKLNNKDPRMLLLLGDALSKGGEDMPAVAAASLLQATAPQALSLDRTPDATKTYQAASVSLRNALIRHKKTVRDTAMKAAQGRFGDCDMSRIARSHWRPDPSIQEQDARRPNLFYIPDLPQRPWLDRDDPAVSDWVSKLESQAGALADEVRDILDIRTDTTPYIADHLKDAEHWQTLAGRTDWGALHFYNDGKCDEAACARFPRIAAALDDLPLMRLNDAPVEAFLSVLHPKTKIPPHYGLANHRLTVHLPLIVPDDCGVSVNGEDRQTKAGSVMIFDDSFEHHAWNDSDDVRIVLIFEIWVPELSEAERFTIAHMLEEHAAFEAGRTALLSAPLMDPAHIVRQARQLLQQKPEAALPWLDLAYGLIRQNRPDEAAQVISLGEDRVAGLRQLHRNHRQPPHLRYLSQRADDTFCQILTDLHDNAIGESAPRRIRDAIWIPSHQGPLPYRHKQQKPHIFYVPDLEANSTYARENLPWTAALEAQTAAIKQELIESLDPDMDGTPYLESHSAFGEEWAKLKGSRDWTGLHLFKNGKPLKDAIARFPRTVAAIDETPVTRLDGTPIEVFFSILKPHTHIPPHYGLANSRMTVHLPLIVPDNCAIRVGDYRHVWREGEVFAFDDSFDHEAWNDSDLVRIVLIFEAWHPDLTDDEINAIERSFSARENWTKNRTIPIA